MKPSYWIIAASVLILDQLTKYWAAATLIKGSIPIAPVLKFTLVHNTGAAFGFMSSAGGWQNVFFMVVAALASVLIAVMLWRLQDRWVGSGLALILGGALGNLVDRALHGYVIDFIDVYYGTWHWPAFNIADSAITVGAVILIIDAFRPKTSRRHA